MKLKKVLGIFIILGLFSTATFAEDLLAKITNGAVSDTSKGVRVLSEEEEREVKGGIVAGLLGGSHTIDNFGNKIMMQAYYMLALTPEEQNRGIAYVGGDTSISKLAQNYLDFKWLTIVNPEVEIPTMFVQYNYKTRQYTTEILAYNTRNGTQRRIQQSFPLIQKINYSLRSQIINHASQYR